MVAPLRRAAWKRRYRLSSSATGAFIANYSIPSMRHVPLILAAEDDLDDQLLIREALERCGAEVEIEFVEDGKMLLQRIELAASGEGGARWPELILLDLGLPGVDGRAALRYLKENEATKALPVLVLTASATEEERSRSYVDGANAFITKPGASADFVRLMNGICGFWFGAARLPSFRN